MPLILLAEDEAPTIDHIRSALASQGWLVKTVHSRDQALRAASEFAPQLVLVNARLTGADDLVRTFSRRSGGPGVVLLSGGNGDQTEPPPGSQDVEAVLFKPLETDVLIEAIRSGLSAAEKKAASPITGGKKIFTSEEIFGDLLDDIVDPAEAPTADSREPTAKPAVEAKPAAKPEVEAKPGGSGEAGAAQSPPAATLPPHIELVDAAEVRPSAASKSTSEAAASSAAKAPASAEPVFEIEAEEPRRTAPRAVPPKPAAAAPADDAKAAAEARRSAVEPTLETAPAEPRPSSDEAPAAGLEDLEEVVRKEVSAWADSGAADFGEAAPDAVGAEMDLSVLLAETEAAAAPTPAPRPAPPSPGDDLDARLEDTLAGVLADSLNLAGTAEAASEPSQADEDRIEALLSRTLGDLGLGGAKASGTSAAPAAAASPARPSPDAATPAAVAAPPEAASAREAEAEPAAGPPPVALEPVPIDDDLLDADAVWEPAVELEDEARDSLEFGDYTLEERIGVGGMAEVWKARRKGVEGFEKRVAIKKILPQAAENEDFVEMFIDEAKLAAQLNHNNIIHIYDLGKIGDDYFIAMEHVEGKNLRQILDESRKRGQRIPVGLALFIASRLAGALDYAHHSKDFDNAALGLVHRDVSPQNVLIGFGGDIKLCDFGIAKAVSKISTTQMGALKGKLQYMSPEQAWGKPIDPRSDIFSLGSLLYEMLAGERLFSGDSEMAILEAVRQCDVAARIIQSSHIPAGVKGLLLKALAREPEDRFETAGDFQHGVDEILSQESPTPGTRELVAYVQGLLDASAPGVDAASRPIIASRAPAAAEALGEIEADTAFDTADEPQGEPLLRRLLGRLLPAILVLLLGGVVGYQLLHRWPAADEGTVARAMVVAPTPVFDPGPVSGAVPAPPQNQPPPGTVATVGSPTPTPSQPSSTRPQGSAAEQAPAAAASARSEAPATPAALREAAPPPAAADVDPELERRVAEELQRVQELITSPPDEPDAGPPSEAAGTVAAAPAAPEVEPAAAPAPTPETESFAASGPASGETAAAEAPTGPPPSEPATGPSSPAGEAAVEPAPAEPLATSIPRLDSPALPVEVPRPAPAAAAPAPEAAVAPGEPVQPGPGVIAPQVVRFEQPAYTPLARRLGASGTVRVSVLVDENGRAEQVRLVEGLPPELGLNDAVLRAARRARYRAATKDGAPVRMWYEVAVRFEP